MRFEYFKADFRTLIAKVKRQYHKLELAHHPNRGGDLRAMQKSALSATLGDDSDTTRP